MARVGDVIFHPKEIEVVTAKGYMTINRRTGKRTFVEADSRGIGRVSKRLPPLKNWRVKLARLTRR